MDTLGELVNCGKAKDAALAAPDRQALTYEQLRAQVDYTATRLNTLGVGRNDTCLLYTSPSPRD